MKVRLAIFPDGSEQGPALYIPKRVAEQLGWMGKEMLDLDIPAYGDSKIDYLIIHPGDSK